MALDQGPDPDDAGDDEGDVAEGADRDDETDVVAGDTLSEDEGVLGADGHFYRRQLEAFSDVILKGAPMTGANIDDGVASVRGMVAIAQSVRTGKPVRIADVAGPV